MNSNSKYNPGEIVVSVIVTAYNNEQFIEQTLQGILSQEVDFKIEVLVNDDASTDTTADKIMQFAKEHPDTVVPIIQTVNQYSQGKKPWSNVLFPAAKGKYLALCEGDDFWTDARKLQRQVDFMESNPEVSFCYHQASILRSDDSLETPEKLDAKFYEAKDVFALRIPTCTVMFRNDLVTVPNSTNNIPHTDIFLWFLLAQKGPFANLGFDGAVRRVHIGGNFSGLDGRKKLKNILLTRKLMLKTGLFNEESKVIIEHSIRDKKKRHLKRVLKEGKFIEYFQVLRDRY